MLKIILHTILNLYISNEPTPLSQREEGEEENLLNTCTKADERIIIIPTAGEILRKINRTDSHTTTSKRIREEAIVSFPVQISYNLLPSREQNKAAILRKFHPSSERSFIRFLNVDLGSLRSCLPVGVVTLRRPHHPLWDSKVSVLQKVCVRELLNKIIAKRRKIQNK